MNRVVPPATDRRTPAQAFTVGTLIGTLGGLIGLGGAEFRLPVLVGWFRFPTLEAVILNKITSLVVVTFALLFRSAAIPWQDVFSHWTVIANVLAGSLAGAWLSAHYATRISQPVLNTTILVLLVGLAIGMIAGHGWLRGDSSLHLTGPVLWFGGVLAGLLIGAVAAVLGVAGGELIIPTLVLLFGIDIKLAGSLSLCISLPTMLVAFARYSQSDAFAVCRREKPFLIAILLGSIVGAAIGAQLLRYVSPDALILILGAILLISAVKVFRH
ncbi:sulfite exporter TauE/SafE family protein [Hydrocarboniphaga effusa]|jgi:uncharacterized membrane protein YfcA|uniref:sulfite exporter TauE/SafE family protein n=1 Tax=Hydrocarboniphaga effusa TaxID=243629 RepID=UPI003138341E